MTVLASIARLVRVRVVEIALGVRPRAALVGRIDPAGAPALVRPAPTRAIDRVARAPAVPIDRDELRLAGPTAANVVVRRVGAMHGAPTALRRGASNRR